ncbi:MAG: replicative DNA helicase [Gammaproteobacteria bacterium]|nr:replicative DNA helicase [Gammaproteobacteria bacterium]
MLHSIESEQAVLGSLLIDNEIMDELDLKVDDFANSANRIIFETMIAMGNEGMPYDVISLYSTLGDRGNEIGGMGYLGNIIRAVAPQNASAYAKIIKDKAKLRKLARIGSEMVERAHSNETTVDIIDFAQSEVLTLDEDQEINVMTVTEILPIVVDSLDERYQNGGELSGLSTGFADLDKITTGLHDGDLVIVAGRPSSGKTTIASNIARHAALEGKSALFFSLEMPKDQIVNREIAAIGSIEFSKIRSGKMEDTDWPRMTSAVSQLNQKRLLIDDSPGLTVNQIRSRARKTKKQHGLSLIVVDYLQLMEGRGDNRTQQIEMISRGLKGLAKELGVPVIALSQLNRSLEQRTNKRPMMSDLRDSGAIEQDADLILFVYRDEVYNEDSPDKGTAEIIIAKQRNGPIGKVRLVFQGQHCRFNNYSDARYNQE